MIIELDYIKDTGILDKERIIFKVTQEGDIGKYLVAESFSTGDTTFSSSIRNAFWFPDQIVKEGDLVVLYTKSGVRNYKLNDDGSTTYFFYWGLSESHNKKEKACIVLLESSWRVKSLDDLSR